MDEREFNRGEIVFIRDYPMGKPLMVHGSVVGFVGKDKYNIKMLNGLQEGNIVLYDSWRLISEKEAKWYHTQER
jgi:hypothetical protein